MTGSDHSLAPERAARFHTLVSALRQLLRDGDPHLTDHATLAEAVYFARRRLDGGDIVPIFVAPS